MIIWYFGGLAAIALALLVLQRTGNSGWVDTIWTFLLRRRRAVANRRRQPEPAAMAARTWMAVWSIRLGSHIALRCAGITDDPR